MQSIRSDDVKHSQDEQSPVASELAPAGPRSGPSSPDRGGLLRSPSGASSLATGSVSRFQRGFTLIEIMVVVVIIGVLGAIVVPQFMSRPDQAKVTAARIDIQAIATALEMYRLDNAHYPSTQQGLEALVKRPSGLPVARGWNPQGYLKSMPVDPWNTPYQYLNPGVRSVDGTYDLYSLGADGVAGGEGFAAEIGNWGH